MKKIIVISILASIIFCSCNQRQSDKYKENIQPIIGNGYPYNIKGIIIIDGCEYFKERTEGYYIYVHKGNCKNPIHKCKCDSDK